MDPALRSRLRGIRQWLEGRATTGAARRNRLIRSRRAPRIAQPLVSVVIPFFNVEQYFDECIRSVRNQTYPHLQIILVDDGSRDGSSAIARRHADQDPRIEIVEQANGGLGHARNTGTRFATGEYLIYLDSDDTVVPAAVATLVTTLQGSGSDFALCAYKRITDSGRTWDPDWIRVTMRAARIGVTIDDVPQLLALHNVMWAKMFRTEFFRTHVKGCPEGTRYEDQEPSARAFICARSFDVLPNRLFNWRIRKDGSSLSQQKHSLDDLTDRLAVVGRVSGFLRDNASTRVRNHWAARVLDHDMRLYLEQVPRVGDDLFWARLREGVQRFVVDMPPGAWSMLDVHSRVLVEAVDSDHRSDILTVLAHIEDCGRSVRLEPMGVDFLAVLPYAEQIATQVSAEHLRVPGELIGARIGLLELMWRDWSTLALRGWAYLENLPADDPSFSVRLELVNMQDGNRRELEVTRMRDPVVQHWSADAFNDQSGSAFCADIDVGSLKAVDPSSGPSADRWRFEVSVGCQGQMRTEPFAFRIADGGLAQVPVAALDGVMRIAPDWAPDSGLMLTQVRPVWILRRCRLEGRTLSVEFRHVDGLVPDVLVVDHGGLSAESSVIDVGPDGWASARIEVPPAPSLHGDGVRWRVRVSDATTGYGRLCWTGDSAAFYGGLDVLGRLHPRLTHHGYLALREAVASAVVTGVGLGVGEIAYRGFLDAGALSHPMLCLEDGVDSAIPSSFVWDRSSLEFEATFTLESCLGRAGRRVSRGLVLDSPDLERPLPATVLETASCHQPEVILSDRVRARASRSYADAQPKLTAGPPLTDLEFSAWGRRHLLSLHRDQPRELDRGGWLFESFSGRLFTDSPRSIFDEVRRRRPDAECFWTVTDLSADIPEGCTPVLLHSEDYIRVLHSVAFLVNNGNFPYYFRKQDGQFYLQTWHGTPLKRIGEDVPGASLSLSYRSLMKREATFWDALLAQNDFSKEVLPRAFGFAGPVWELGYPRNDSLLGVDRESRRERVRSSLGIPPHRQVVLYAPTWRDSEKSVKGYVLVAHLDFGKLADALGDGSTVLLRGHQNTAGTARPAGVVDVTDYPEVNDLFLAADVLITDYSSLMFDFALTGKPIIFMVPDLEVYRDATRGFYLDLEAIAPGPLLSSDDEVVEELMRLRDGGAWDTERYSQFRGRFLPQDDGLAAARVVDQLLGESGT
jgi:CDP-glycerol glycerophosphotransferase